MSTAEQIIAEHRDAGYLDGRRYCLCGWSTIDHDGIDQAAEHSAHVVAALTNAGKTIVDDENSGHEYGVEHCDASGERVTIAPFFGVGTAESCARQLTGNPVVRMRRVWYGDWEPAAARVAEGGERGA
ncbi:hypothetical protein GS810_01675 [Rhodococcus hoagii]|nr:hypothetical protein [Prescottella equi]NKU90784.1 hypothetical protein [Prescottella equi]